MKTKVCNLLIGLFLLVSTVACTKDSATPQPEFFVKAEKDGAAWVVKGSGVYAKAQGEFYIFGQQSTGSGTEEYLRLGFSVPKELPYPIEQVVPAAQVIPAYWGALLGGDVLINSYTALSAVDGTRLQVTRLDTVQKIVEGTFDTTLRRDAHWSAQGETMRFSQGSFRVRYQQFQ
jgi:hypothetical protein